MTPHKPRTVTANGRQGSNWISRTKRQQIYLRDCHRCLYCGADLRDVDARLRTLDHLMSRQAGGTHTPDNLVTACLSCNARRGAIPWIIFATPLAIKRILRAVTLPLGELDGVE